MTTETEKAPGPAAVSFGLPLDFWERVRYTSNRLLMLDYDGTLAPFRVERMEARPPEATMNALREMIRSGHTSLVIVSGRPTEQINELLGGLDVELFGSHGFERASPGGMLVREELSDRETSGLNEARRAAGAANLTEHVEVKPASIAVHVRGLDSNRSLETEELTWNIFTPIADKYDLECRAFNGGVEIRSRRFHKGKAVEAMLGEAADHPFVAYVGDDDTDEDAFRVLSAVSEGVGVKVGGAPTDTAAQGWIESQQEVLPFLRRWHETALNLKRTVPRSLHRSRLIVVSNRLPGLGAAQKSGRQRPIGGLATALEAALSENEAGGLWMGWSGKITETRRKHELREFESESMRLLGLDLTKREYEAYYNGFSNNTIWPLFHSFPTLAKMSGWQLEVYRSVNELFAHSLDSALEKNDLVWVHDYHLMPLGAELRRVGWEGRLGFFLHIPFPSLDTLAVLPEFEEFLGALHQYDIIGFQTQTYLDNYVYACRRILGAQWDGYVLHAGKRYQRAGVYPVGIDVDRFLPPSAGESKAPAKSVFGGSLEGRSIILGVDRLDYTKGMPQRTLAFEALLRHKPELRGKVSFVQISSPSRTEVEEYMEQKRLMDSLVGRINGEFGEHDWEPIRYLYRTYDQNRLSKFYRQARVGLVTPLRDGMNLVAKEYVASQNPDDPGMLTLSRFAGAADELSEAVIVNPYLPEDTARGIATALEMPLEERRRRHQAMMTVIKSQTVQKWAKDFIFDLQSV
ncbi:MAG: trehalose-phosphatase [Candidatus Zixiibacteriota bacterium]